MIMSSLLPYQERMRVAHPIWHAPDGAWEVFRYADVRRVLTASDDWSAALSDGPTTSFNFLDPPAHGRLRALAARAINPRAIERRAPRIDARIRGLLNRALARDPAGLDVVADLAAPLPVLVLADWLGIPPADEERFGTWAAAFITKEAFLSPPDPPGLRDYILALVEQRRHEPKDAEEGLISGLVWAMHDGVGLTDDEILNICRVLLVAGNDTITYLIGNALVCLVEAETLDTVRAAPALLSGAIEETLRYRPPVPAMFRRARRTIVLGDQTIDPGAKITAWIGAANRDPAQFPDPDRFDLARDPTTHLAFGDGIHRCIGAPLARLVAYRALDALLRLPPFALDRSTPLEPVDPQGFVDGYQRLPIRFA